MLTSNGKPLAILPPFTEDTLEKSLCAVRCARSVAAVEHLQRRSVRSGTGRLSPLQSRVTFDSRERLAAGERGGKPECLAAGLLSPFGPQRPTFQFNTELSNVFFDQIKASGLSVIGRPLTNGLPDPADEALLETVPGMTQYASSRETPNTFPHPDERACSW
jgi:hypothetical protein